jgi:hypothetical protein
MKNSKRHKNPHTKRPINMNYIRKWLLKQVGRNWDDVWSDVCYVYKDNDSRHLFNSWITDVYVHPETNILTLIDMKEKSVKKKYLSDRINIDNRIFICRNGVWFECKEELVGCYDVYFCHTDKEWKLNVDTPIKITSNIKTVSKRDKRKIGITHCNQTGHVL